MKNRRESGLEIGQIRDDQSLTKTDRRPGEERQSQEIVRELKRFKPFQY